jgi:hypothetical protein
MAKTIARALCGQDFQTNYVHLVSTPRSVRLFRNAIYDFAAEWTPDPKHHCNSGQKRAVTLHQVLNKGPWL